MPTKLPDIGGNKHHQVRTDPDGGPGHESSVYIPNSTLSCIDYSLSGSDAAQSNSQHGTLDVPCSQCHAARDRPNSQACGTRIQRMQQSGHQSISPPFLLKPRIAPDNAVLTATFSYAVTFLIKVWQEKHCGLKLISTWNFSSARFCWYFVNSPSNWDRYAKNLMSHPEQETQTECPHHDILFILKQQFRGSFCHLNLCCRDLHTKIFLQKAVPFRVKFLKRADIVSFIPPNPKESKLTMNFFHKHLFV